MKKIILCLFCVSLLVSCQSKGEKQAKLNEDKVVECVRNSLTSPSTMNVVSIVHESRDAKIIIDTLYHVKSIQGKYNKIGDMKIWFKINAVTIDSLQEAVRCFPAHTLYTVQYDAQNVFGAMVRDEDDVALLEDGSVLLSEDFFFKFYDNPQSKLWAITPTKYSDVRVDNEMMISEGDWCSKSRLWSDEE